jgi:cysteine-rich repeat protein
MELGAACGDGTVNLDCGEECDPPGALCTDQCARVPMCGDGVTSPGEACDDGNTTDCDGCSATCTVESGCGDGVRCASEECDDGNGLACDGCSPACIVEVGAHCGDGLINQACGEECDPPGAGCSLICTAGDGVLGSRTLTVGGAFYSSALGTSVPLGSLTGSMELIGGTIGAGGIAPVEVDGPVYYEAPILGGQFGTFCVRIDGCTGQIDCDGGTAVDVLTVQDSNGPGHNGLPPTITIGMGDTPAGALLLDCQQRYVQLGPGEDCGTATYPAAARIVYTTGAAEAFYLNGNPKVGTGAIRFAGEPFSCSAWQVTDGPGQLAGTFMDEDNAQAGDTANLALIDD